MRPIKTCYRCGASIEKGDVQGKCGVCAARMSMLDMADITKCVICKADLSTDRAHVDTCGERCFKKLLAYHRRVDA